MKNRFKRILKKLAPFIVQPQGEIGVKKLGHRKYVGGMWEELGQLQLDFLVSRGLRPDSYLLDIACGSLRLGVKAIDYLEPGHYLGIEKEAALIKAGVEHELARSLRERKRPRLVVSDSFEFNLLEKNADFAIAQSLFSHLPGDTIRMCFEKLYPHLNERGRFFATFFETETPADNPKIAHDHDIFSYTREQMRDFGEAAGFEFNYIGAWNHPREQIMVEYKRKE